MPELLEIQRRFAVALRQRDAAGSAGRWLAGDAATIERGLSIYRANVAAATQKALSAAYPVLRQLLGAALFARLVSAYAAATPSTSGDLTGRGADFDVFVAGFEPAQELPCSPCLPDLARLEWRVHLAEGAADATPCDPRRLGAVAPDRQGDIRFTWAPGTAVIDSGFPIVRIWTMQQAGGEAASFEAEGSAGEHALVARAGWRVAVTALDAGEAAFIARSLAGAALGAATAAALQAEPGFDLARLLTRAFTGGMIRSFELDERPAG